MAPSTVPPSPSYSESSKQVKPNPHPYAIKTTSTGILTRSNSTASQNSSKHFYVPQSPSQSSSPTKSKGHRLSKSLSTDPLPNPNPRPLPTPPTDFDDWTSPKWNKRADTSSGSLSHEDSNLGKLEDLPSNPKIWTSSQLSSYLTTSLRVRSGETLSLPLPVARDIAAFVKESKINGRLFLRLSEQDLEGMGLNKLWQSALLSASRTLRQNILKGRIWGESDSVPFSSNIYNSASSSSSVDISDAEQNSLSIRKPRRHRNGRVRGMVESLERSGSFSSDSSFNGVLDGADDQCVDEEVVSSSPIASVNSSPVRRPLPVPPLHPSLRDFPTGDSEEPSIEELLDAEQGIVSLKGPWGARAWEEIDRNPGVTVKKLLIENGSARDVDGLSTIVSSRSGDSGGSTKLRDERRIVTSIFSPSKAKLEEEADELMKCKEEEMDALLKSSNELLETFKMRLEQVEQRVGEMEDSERALQLELSRRSLENEVLKQKLEAANPNKIMKNERPDSQSMSALSQYVLLAGIGVCSVVLKVVLRNIVGRKAIP